MTACWHTNCAVNTKFDKLDFTQPRHMKVKDRVFCLWPVKDEVNFIVIALSWVLKQFLVSISSESRGFPLVSVIAFIIIVIIITKSFIFQIVWCHVPVVTGEQMQPYWASSQAP